MSNVLSLLSTYGLTMIIEYPILQAVWLFIRDKNEKNTTRLVFWNNRIVIIPVIIVNLLTNPAINIYASHLFYDTSISENVIWAILSALEVVIFMVEAILYKFMLKTKWTSAFLLSFSANFTSYMVSFII